MKQLNLFGWPDPDEVFISFFNGRHFLVSVYF